jgi:RNA polymerase sigma factor (sigma-70 family)
MRPLPSPQDAASTDAEVLAASIDEPSAFAAVFDRHFPAIHGWLRRRVGASLADDLAAETFTRAFDARHRFDPGRAGARPWLFGIAAHLVADHRRAEVRRLGAVARPDPGELITEDQEAATLARADAATLGPALAAALAGLRSQERDALLLAAWADLDYEQIAQATGVPVGTVRSRLHRARRHLRAALAAHTIDRGET